MSDQIEFYQKVISEMGAILLFLVWLILSQYRDDQKSRKRMDHLTDIINNLTKK